MNSTEPLPSWATEVTHEETLALCERLHKVFTDEFIAMVGKKRVGADYIMMILASLSINLIGGASGRPPTADNINTIVRLFMLEVLETRSVLLEVTKKHEAEEQTNVNP